MKFISRMPKAWVAVLALVCLTGNAANQPKPAGIVIFVAGDVTAAAGEMKSHLVKIGSSLFNGDRIKTGSNGRASLIFTDGSQVKLNYNTDLILKSKEIQGEKNLRGINAVKLFVGNIWSKITHNPKSTFDIETTSAVAAVKGSSGEVSVDGQDTTCIKWVDGNVKVFNDLGSSGIKDSQQLCVAKGTAPGKAEDYVPTSTWQNQVKAGTQGGTVKVILKGENGASQEVLINMKPE